VRLIPNGKTIDVEVADNGAGISAELLPKVFERFRQGSKSEDRRNGLGLGLAIVRNLVEMHGGRVKAASEGEDRGANIYRYSAISLKRRRLKPQIISAQRRRGGFQR
jgi:signal transduction histidine kinase